MFAPYDGQEARTRWTVNHNTKTAIPSATGPQPVSDLTGDRSAESAETQSCWRAFWLEWVKPLVVIALVMFSFRSAVADWNDVPTGSMKPTILEGDRIFINKVAYDLKFPFTTYRLLEWGDPLRGEVVVLRSPEDNKRLVKRVVGLPGDLIEVRRKYLREEDMVVSVLYINRQPVEYAQPDPEVVRQVRRVGAAQLRIRYRDRGRACPPDHECADPPSASLRTVSGPTGPLLHDG